MATVKTKPKSNDPDEQAKLVAEATADAEFEVKDGRIGQDDVAQQVEDETTVVEPGQGLSFLDLDEPQTETNAIIYGQPGSGKTRLGATSPKPLIIDLERGASASVKSAGNPDAKVYRADNYRDVQRAFAYLRKGGHGFETVVLDPVGELQRIIMEHVIKSFPDQKRPYGDIPTMQDWQKSLNDATKLVTAFRSLPMRTVLIAHAQIPDHEEDMVKPLVSGKHFISFFMGAMDLLGYLYVEEVDGELHRKLQTVASSTVVAKNRGGHLPDIVTDPNMAEIFTLMEGGGR